MFRSFTLNALGVVFLANILSIVSSELPKRGSWRFPYVIGVRIALEIVIALFAGARATKFGRRHFHLVGMLGGFGIASCYGIFQCLEIASRGDIDHPPDEDFLATATLLWVLPMFAGMTFWLATIFVVTVWIGWYVMFAVAEAITDGYTGIDLVLKFVSLIVVGFACLVGQYMREKDMRLIFLLQKEINRHESGIANSAEVLQDQLFDAGAYTRAHIGCTQDVANAGRNLTWGSLRKQPPVFFPFLPWDSDTHSNASSSASAVSTSQLQPEPHLDQTSANQADDNHADDELSATVKTQRTLVGLQRTSRALPHKFGNIPYLVIYSRLANPKAPEGMRRFVSGLNRARAMAPLPQRWVMCGPPQCVVIFNERTSTSSSATDILDDLRALVQLYVQICHKYSSTTEVWSHAVLDCASELYVWAVSIQSGVPETFVTGCAHGIELATHKIPSAPQQLAPRSMQSLLITETAARAIQGIGERIGTSPTAPPWLPASLDAVSSYPSTAVPAITVTPPAVDPLVDSKRDASTGSNWTRLIHEKLWISPAAGNAEFQVAWVRQRSIGVPASGSSKNLIIQKSSSALSVNDATATSPTRSIPASEDRLVDLESANDAEFGQSSTSNLVDHGERSSRYFKSQHHLLQSSRPGTGRDSASVTPFMNQFGEMSKLIRNIFIRDAHEAEFKMHRILLRFASKEKEINYDNWSIDTAITPIRLVTVAFILGWALNIPLDTRNSSKDNEILGVPPAFAAVMFRLFVIAVMIIGIAVVTIVPPALVRRLFQTFVSLSLLIVAAACSLVIQVADRNLFATYCLLFLRTLMSIYSNFRLRVVAALVTGLVSTAICFILIVRSPLEDEAHRDDQDNLASTMRNRMYLMLFVVNSYGILYCYVLERTNRQLYTCMARDEGLLLSYEQLVVIREYWLEPQQRLVMIDNMKKTPRSSLANIGQQSGASSPHESAPSPVVIPQSAAPISYQVSTVSSSESYFLVQPPACDPSLGKQWLESLCKRVAAFNEPVGAHRVDLLLCGPFIVIGPGVHSELHALVNPQRDSAPAMCPLSIIDGHTIYTSFNGLSVHGLIGQGISNALERDLPTRA